MWDCGWKVLCCEGLIDKHYFFQSGVDDIGFRSLHEGNNFVVFSLGNMERLQRRVGMFEEDRPIAFADAELDETVGLAPGAICAAPGARACMLPISHALNI